MSAPTNRRPGRTRQADTPTPVTPSAPPVLPALVTLAPAPAAPPIIITATSTPLATPLPSPIVATQPTLSHLSRPALLTETPSPGGVAKADNSLHHTGDVGTMALAVRHDTTGSLVAANGDYTPLQVDANGNLKTTASVTLSNLAVTSLVPGVTATALGKAQQAAFATGDVGVAGWAVRGDTPTSLCSAAGQYTPLQVDATGQLYTVSAGGSTETTLAALRTATSTASSALTTQITTLQSTMNSIHTDLSSNIVPRLPGSGTVLTDTQLRASAVPVSGTITANAGTGTMAVSVASLPLPALAALDSSVVAITTALGTPAQDDSVQDVVTALNATNFNLNALSAALPLPTGAATETTVGGLLTNTQLRATAVPVTANAGTGTFAVSASSLPLPTGAATNSTLSGLLTNTQLRATPVPVSGTITANAGTGTFGVADSAVASALSTLDGHVTSGIVLAAGTNVIGTVTANAGTGTLAVSASALPLPSGAATATNQATANTSLNNIDTSTAAINSKLASALPLPTGAATEANQATANSNLASIFTVLNTLDGHVTSGIVLATGSHTIGTVTANAGTGTFGVADSAVASALSTLDGHVTSGIVLATGSNSIGAVTANAGTGTFAISASTLPLPSGAATAAKQDTLASAISTLDGHVTSGIVLAAGSHAIGTVTANAGSGTFLVNMDPNIGIPGLANAFNGIALNQTEMIVSLSNIDTSTAAVNTNTATTATKTGNIATYISNGNKVQNNAFTAGTDVGHMALAVRQATATSVTTTDGHYAPLEVVFHLLEYPGWTCDEWHCLGDRFQYDWRRNGQCRHGHVCCFS